MGDDLSVADVQEGVIQATLWPFGTSWAGEAPLLALVATAIAFAILWVRSLRTADCGIVDLYWGFGFAVIAWIEFLAAPTRGPALLLLALVTLWSLRLGIHLTRRHMGAHEEDPRYAKMRERSGPNWPVRSFVWVFMLQALVMWLIAVPLHVAFAAADADASTGALVLGTLLFAVGFALESAADAALTRFRADPANRGHLLTTGLFAWSRHPNYFGEAVLWWGLGLIAFGISGSWLCFAGPALLTLLLVKVSGVPPLEEHLSSRPGYAEWVRRTSPFLPLPPRPPRDRTIPID